MSKKYIIICLALSLLISGCVSLQYKPVELGMTEQTVLDNRGKPNFVKQEGDLVVWEYVDYRTNNDGYPIQYTALVVYFKDNKVVKKSGSGYRYGGRIKSW